MLEQRLERSCSAWTAGVTDAMVVGTMAVSMSLAQLNNDFVMGVVFSLGSLATVCIFSLSFVPLSLTSSIPLLAVRFTLWSYNNTMVGLGDVGQWQMVGG